MSLDVLLISDEMIKARTSMHGNIDPSLIYPDIKVAQDMFIHPCLGTALYNKIQTLISAGTLSDGANVNYKTLVDKYIVDALIYFTLSELPTTISYQFWNKGVLRKQGDNTELPSMSDLVEISNKYKQRAEFYLNRLSLYIRENAPEMFPEYLNPGNGIDDMYPENKAFTLPIYLGDDSSCGKSYAEKYQGNKPSC